ncbi:hypothetical protein CBS101457_006586 [Exobasidium rhododendri]|nr:hypothetical protein CBS101457_006586 [Exobasidium rhododendri]
MSHIDHHEEPSSSASAASSRLSLPEYKRYGRQMILSGFGLQGQIKLKEAKVLVVGAGGLGCPAVQYLAASGVGHISIVDHDHVETSNLARQILHTDGNVGLNKALSAAQAGQIINPHIRLEAIQEMLSVDNAVALIARHDIVLDCTDNVLTRYLISDAAVMCGVQVVSGAGQGLEGQLVVLHKNLSPHASASGHSIRPRKGKGKRGPCYRCLFPKAPRPEDVTDCEDGGVLGGVTGVVGTMQAVEAVKLLVGMSDEEPPCLTLVTPFNHPPFRTIKLRPQRATTCRACGDPEQMTAEAIETKIKADLSSEDYVAFCGIARLPTQTSNNRQVDVHAKEERQGLLVDVRPQVEYEITHLVPSVNIPFRTLLSDPQAAHDRLRTLAAKLEGEDSIEKDVAIYLVCRKGNDSILAQSALLSCSPADSITSLDFVNVKGGLRAWSEQVDGSFPVY